MRTLTLASEAVSGKADGIVAPVRGLNTKTPLAGLSQDFAITLDNWVCQPDAIVTRGGALSVNTGLTGGARSLMQYSAGAVNQMFCASSSGIFNVSTAGAVGGAVLARTSGVGKSVNFGTSAGQFLYFCNGVDTPAYYNGTSWVAVTGVSTPAITGVTTTLLFDVETYRQRLYFLANNTLGFWYLPADSVGGAATLFNIGSLCRLGGRVVGHGTWSIDVGAGPDDYYVLATSNGELVVFRGSDPGVVANWSYVGTYYIGRPVGQNCFTKVGGDLMYMCENGLIPVSKLRQSTAVDYTQSVTTNIAPTIAALFAQYSALAGWKVHYSAKRSLLILNIPTSTTQAVQYVYNMQSRGWSSFSGWNAFDFIEYGGETYFSTGTIVVKAFTGTNDFGADIVATMDTSYNRFGTREQLLPAALRVLFGSTSGISYTLGLAQDFTNVYSEAVYVSGGGLAGLWDSGLWDTALWGGSYNLSRNWVTIAASGAIALSTRFRVSSKFASTLLLAIDYKFLKQGLIS